MRFFMCDQCGCGATDAENTFEEKVKEVIDSVRLIMAPIGRSEEPIAFTRKATEQLEG